MAGCSSHRRLTVLVLLWLACLPCTRPLALAAGSKRVRREMRTYYNDSGEEVTGGCGCVGLSKGVWLFG